MTPLGRHLRALRAERGLTLKEMAEGLGVSSAYLSALEHGKRGVPNWFFVQRIIAFLNLIWDDAEEIQRLVLVSDPKVAIETTGLSPEATELANRLARTIDRLSPEDCRALMEALEAQMKGG